MDCPEVVRRLWEYLDGELAAEEAGAVRLHLESCSQCRPACHCDRAFLLLLSRSLRASAAAPSTLAASVRARLWPDAQ
ncbi:MAG: anti-sigma factor family protein [Gemmatimonadales bacterium]